MAAEQEIRNMSEDNIFDALMEQYGKAAGESISAMLKTKVEIKAPEKSETLVKDVEYSILEPALFVKSCLTSNAAGNIVMIFRQRDIQAFLNKLMGSDDLPDPDFEFDEVAMSAAGELLNQMVHSAAKSVAEYLENTMDSSDCQLFLSDSGQRLWEIMGEDAACKTTVIRYGMTIGDLMETEFLECISETATDSLMQEIRRKSRRRRNGPSGRKKNETASKSWTACRTKTVPDFWPPGGLTEPHTGKRRSCSRYPSRREIWDC